MVSTWYERKRKTVRILGSHMWVYVRVHILWEDMVHYEWWCRCGNYIIAMEHNNDNKQKPASNRSWVHRTIVALTVGNEMHRRASEWKKTLLLSTSSWLKTSPLYIQKCFAEYFKIQVQYYNSLLIKWSQFPHIYLFHAAFYTMFHLTLLFINADNGVITWCGTRSPHTQQQI